MHAYRKLQMRKCCDGLMNDRHLKLWRMMVQMYSWQRQTPMWVNIKDSFKQLFLIQDSTIHHHVLWFWSRRVREARVKVFTKAQGITQAAESAVISVCALTSVIEGFTSYWKHEIHGLKVENYDSSISRFCAWIWHTVKFRFKK